MRTQTRIGRGLRIAAITLLAGASFALPAAAQKQAATLEDQPDAQRTKEELSELLQHYPPALRSVLALDPKLMENEAYLAPYPALAAFLQKHPEVEHNAVFYVGEPPHSHADGVPAVDLWREAMNNLVAFAGFGLAAGVLFWLIRTTLDYRRWTRLSKIQTEVHSKLLDRFTASDDLLAYIQSPAGKRFLESSPITLDSAPQSIGAPLGRILWSVQGGVVLLAGGIGLQIVSYRISDTLSQQSLQGVGIVGTALGIGFLASALISFLISRRLGLIEPGAAARLAAPGA